jgi:hypothetical protein
VPRRTAGQSKDRPFLERLDDTVRDAMLVRDPGAEPEEAAAALHRLYEWQVPTLRHGAALVEDIGPERTRAIVEAALVGEPTSAAVALAADLALAEGDPGAAADRVLEARALVDHPYLWLRLARAREQQGRVVEATRELGDALERDPGVQEAQLLRGELVARLAAWEAHQPFDCPCGSGLAYRACCEEGARRLLAGFRDRGLLQDLCVRVDAFVERTPELRDFLGDSLREWVQDVGLNPESVDDESRRLVRLAAERAWTTPIDGGERTILADFASDGQTSPEQAEVASEWNRWKAWSLWQVDELGEPGVLLTEYLTGVPVYAHLAPEQRRGLQRWSVLLGCFGPVRGVWRSGWTLVEVAPATARALGGRVVRFAERVGRQGNGRHQTVADWAQHVGRELDACRWLPDRAERAPRGIARTARNAVSVMLPSLVAEARRSPQAAPAPGGAPDEPVGVLDDLSLREAAAREDYADRLEVFLRELEHGQAGVGQEPAVADLRRELGVP